MTKRSIVFTLLTLTSFWGHCQTFDLSDSAVAEGDVYIIDLLWDLESYAIRPEGYPKLDSLVTFLQDHQNLTIEIGNHRDQRGSDDYSRTWTGMRAKSVLDYLVKKGIDPERLSSKGYERSKPLIVGAKTDEEHQMNRRTEIKIMRTDYVRKD